MTKLIISDKIDMRQHISADAIKKAIQQLKEEEWKIASFKYFLQLLKGTDFATVDEFFKVLYAIGEQEGTHFDIDEEKQRGKIADTLIHGEYKKNEKMK
ncbi:hypothetical protein J4410_05815 [Candidatus Woesearchaeota archaeon]|nr:hypothetical protein [Candidatus Woesearchaeota archaeon]